jgi:hypothetical protein
MRERVKEHFPTVLLTLLSIVQALALELLWSHLRATTGLFETSWTAVISWLQIIATFLGLILIWVVYANNVMRFRWVPVSSESVYPFLIGLTEFMLIESLGSGEVGQWFIFMALIFGMMTLVAHVNMRQARQDPDNKVLFSNLQPAKLRDFYPTIAIVIMLMLFGFYLMISGEKVVPVMLALLATNGMLAWQYYTTARFWKLTMTEAPKA